MTNLATQIAERIHALRYEDITPDAHDWTASAFVDTVGCTLAGINEDGPQILLRVPGVAAAPGPALILGTSRRTRLGTQSAHQIMTAAKATEDAKLRESLS